MKIFGWLTNGIKAIKGCFKDISNYRALKRYVKAYEDEPGSEWYNLKYKHNKLYTIFFRDVSLSQEFERYTTPEQKQSYLYSFARPAYEFFTAGNFGEVVSLNLYHFFDEENPENEVYTYRIEFEFIPYWIGRWVTFRQILYMLLGLGVIATGIVFLCLYA